MYLFSRPLAGVFYPDFHVAGGVGVQYFEPLLRQLCGDQDIEPLPGPAIWACSDIFALLTQPHDA